jgi:hypothetical protein
MVKCKDCGGEDWEKVMDIIGIMDFPNGSLFQCRQCKRVVHVKTKEQVEGEVL